MINYLDGDVCLLIFKFATKIIVMKAIYVICSIVFFFTIQGCKQDNAANVSSESDSTPIEQKQTAEKQQDSRPTTSGHDYTFLTEKILVINTVFSDDKSDQLPKKNDWLHLVKDGTYKAGRGKDQTHTGQWSYEPNGQTLFLRPDTKDYKMSEWKVMFTDNVVVLVGTSTYGNNATQIQMLKRNELPQ